MRPTKNKSTPEGRKFWEAVEKTAAEVKTWPSWKREETLGALARASGVIPSAKKARG